jgi:hypothetical protein
MGWCAVAFIAFGALGLVSISGVWLFHMVTPVSWHWLTDEQVGHIQTLLFSGTVSATLALLARKVYGA